GVEWAISDGNTVTGDFLLQSGVAISADAKQAPVSNDFYYIVPDKCTECVGFHEEPQCAAVCPVDCCVPDPDHVDSQEELLERKSRLHL
ncbi:MAG: ferredoxin, partial [Saprospiraceae bacterium]